MSKVFVISDLHFGHLNMAIKRGFKSSEEHDNHIIENWNSVVSTKDVVWILGDISMEKSGPFVLLDKLNGIKKVVLGNHDMPQHVPELLKHVNHVCSSFTKKNIIFTHIPIHEQEISRFRRNIHGHLHENKITMSFENGTLIDPRFVNVSCECVNFTPVELSTLIN